MCNYLILSTYLAHKIPNCPFPCNTVLIHINPNSKDNKILIFNPQYSLTPPQILSTLMAFQRCLHRWEGVLNWWLVLLLCLAGALASFIFFFAVVVQPRTVTPTYTNRLIIVLRVGMELQVPTVCFILIFSGGVKWRGIQSGIYWTRNMSIFFYNAINLKCSFQIPYAYD